MSTPDLLFAEYRPGIYRYLCRVVGHADTARDLTQDVCHRHARRLELHLWGSILNLPTNLPVRPLDSPMRMQVWLVHHAPAGEEHTYRLAVPFDPADTRFVFRTVGINTPDGTFHVDIDGQFRAVTREDGTAGLWTGVRRSIVDSTTGVIRTSGGSGPVVAWVAPGDVLSFDLPMPGGASRGGGTGGGGGRGGGRGGVAGGVANSAGGGTTPPLPLRDHRFSIRVQFTAVP